MDSRSEESNASASPAGSLEPPGPASATKETDLCLVCGDQANGVHYNVLSCEGCKSFYLRSIKNKAVDTFHCTNPDEGNCEIDMFTRRKCPFCRMKKCKKLGMSSEKVWNEKRLVTRKPLERKKKVKGYKEASTEMEVRMTVDKMLPDSGAVKPVVVVELTHSQKVLAQFTGACFAKAIEPITCYPKVAELKTSEMESSQTGMPESQASSTTDFNISQEAMQFNMESITLFVMQLVAFAKSLPDFERLSLEDKQVVIKEGVTETLAVRCAYCFQPDIQQVVIYENAFGRQLINTLGTPAFGELFWKFLSDFKALGLNTEETALYLAIVLFTPDRPGLANNEVVEEIQAKYVSCLECCVRANHPQPQNELFPRLMLKLVNLRDITSSNSNTLLKLKLEKKHSFTPFFAELYDL